MIEELKKMFNMPNALPQELANNVIIYLRKSRKDSEFSNEPLEKTLERHEIMLQDYAKNTFGITIQENNIFREVVSGDTIADRPKMQEVLNLIENDNIKAVLCVETERLARGNSIDQGVIVQKFQLTGTKIITPAKIFDLDNEFDLSFFEDGLYQARKYLNYTKKILARGKLQSAKEGKPLCSIPSWGYGKEKLKGEKGYVLVKNDDNWKARKLFDLFIYEDFGTTEVAKKLNSLGIAGPKNPNWTAAMVRNILNRADVYAGYNVYNKRKEIKKYVNGKIITTRPINNDCIIAKAKHEPTITEEELQMVKTKLKTYSKNSTKKNFITKNPLASIITCGLCGRKIQRRPYSKSFLKSGKIHEDTLICTNINCNNTSSNLKTVEEKILQEIKFKEKEMFLGIKNFESNNSNSDELKKEIDLLYKKIKKLTDQKNNACELLEQKIYSTDMFFERMNIINKELESANNNIKNLEEKIQNNQQNNYETFYPQLKKITELYNKLSAEDKNKLLKSIIKDIKYTKTNKNGRHEKSAEIDFSIEIEWRF